MKCALSICDMEFARGRANRKFCSKRCSTVASLLKHYTRQPERIPVNGSQAEIHPPAKALSIAELKVATAAAIAEDIAGDEDLPPALQKSSAPIPPQAKAEVTCIKCRRAGGLCTTHLLEQVATAT
jgi:hypothetical protein